MKQQKRRTIGGINSPVRVRALWFAGLPLVSQVYRA
jgi:hypothetical protein